MIRGSHEWRIVRSLRKHGAHVVAFTPERLTLPMLHGHSRKMPRWAAAYLSGRLAMKITTSFCYCKAPAKCQLANAAAPAKDVIVVRVPHGAVDGGKKRCQEES